MSKYFRRLAIVPALLTLAGCFEFSDEVRNHLISFLDFSYGGPVTPVPAGLYEDEEGIRFDLRRTEVAGLDGYEYKDGNGNTGIAFLYDVRSDGYFMLHAGTNSAHWLTYDPESETIEFRELLCSMLSPAERREFGYPADIAKTDSCYPDNGGDIVRSALLANRRFDPAVHPHRRLTPVSSRKTATPSHPVPAPAPRMVPTPTPRQTVDFRSMLSGRTVYLHEGSDYPNAWLEAQLLPRGGVAATMVRLEDRQTVRGSQTTGRWQIAGDRLCLEDVQLAGCYTLRRSYGEVIDAIRAGQASYLPTFTNILTDPSDRLGLLDEELRALLTGNTIYLRRYDRFLTGWEEIDLAANGNFAARAFKLGPDGARQTATARGQWSFSDGMLCLERSTGSDCLFVDRSDDAGLSLAPDDTSRPAFTDTLRDPSEPMTSPFPKSIGLPLRDLD